MDVSVVEVMGKYFTQLYRKFEQILKPLSQLVEPANKQMDLFETNRICDIYKESVQTRYNFFKCVVFLSNIVLAWLLWSN